MSTRYVDQFQKPARPRFYTLILVVLSLGLVLALAGNVYQFVRIEHVQRDLALTQISMGRLTDAAASIAEENQQRFAAIKSQLQDVTVATLMQARSESKRASAQVQHRLEQKNQELLGELSGLKEDTNSKLEQVSENLGKVNGDLHKTGSDLKRVSGGLDVMSGEVATNSQQLAALKGLGDRDYFEFDLTKTKQPQKVGDIRIALKKTDPKRSRYTLAIVADDKIVEKKDRTINEPVQVYVSGGRQPYEIVVNVVKKNEVVGYLATPKVRIARGRAFE